jgi:hypothetical protein
VWRVDPGGVGSGGIQYARSRKRPALTSFQASLVVDPTSAAVGRKLLRATDSGLSDQPVSAADWWFDYTRGGSEAGRVQMVDCGA